MEELTKQAKVRPSTVRNGQAKRFVSGPNNLAAVMKVLEDAGVKVIPENGGGAGVKRRGPSAPN